MKRILLVNSNTEIAPYPVAPLGLCMVATALEKSGYNVKVFDSIGNQNSGHNNQLEDILKDFQPEVIGVSVRNIDDLVMQKPIYYVDEIDEFCIKPIKNYGKGITVLGGSGYSLYPYELLKRWEFDYGIIGPGEKTLIALLDSIEKKDLSIKIPGVLRNSGKGIITGKPTIPLPKRKKTLQLPLPEVDSHLDYEPYKERSSYPIQTKRGCALKCLYCSYPVLEGRSYQLRSAKNVVDEMEKVIKRLPDTIFEFVDSTFNHPSGHAENICREIINRGLKVRLRTMGVNPSGVTPELIHLMKKAGFTQIDCTPDSASDKMLKQLRKGFNRKKLEQTSAILKEADMPTMWFFVLGGPGENEETLEETFDFINNFIDERDLVHLTEGLRIYPKTGLADIAIEEGVISKDESLLTPHFYVSDQLGTEKLSQKIKEFTSRHYNCLRSVESTPTPEMIKMAMDLREKEGFDKEPMFRTLLKVRKNMLATNRNLQK